jgi:hypothetical protein
MATLAAIRDAIRTTVEAVIPALQVYARLGVATNLPAMVVSVADVDYDLVMNRSTMQWEFDLSVLASAGHVVLGQYTLDDLVDIGGPGSIVHALYGSDLGLANTQAHVAGLSGYGGTFEGVGLDHVGAQLRLIVITERTGV